MKKILLSLLILMVVAITACHKTMLTVYTVNGDLKAAFNFKVGTYWIYTDSLSGASDSFFVTGNTGITENHLDHNGDGYTMEKITINISEKSIGSNTTTQFWKYVYEGNTMNVYYSGTGIQTSEYIPMINFPFHDPITTYPKSLVQSYTDTASIDAYIYTYIIGSQYFYDDAMVTHRVNSSLHNYSDTFYLSQSYGIFKMILHHPADGINRVWIVQDYNIVNR